MAKNKKKHWTGYTVDDCDCRYCLYYGGRKNRKVKCLAPECVCKAELKEAVCRERNEKEGEIKNVHSAL